MMWIALVLVGATAPPMRSAIDSPGRVDYDRHCGVCHGDEGRGKAAPPLVPLDKELSEVLAIVREGLGEMPPVGPSSLSDEGVKRVVDYLRQLSAPPATQAEHRRATATAKHHLSVNRNWSATSTATGVPSFRPGSKRH